jgi:ribosomal protein L32
MVTKNTVQVVMSTRVNCWCGYANDEDFLLDIPDDKAQPMKACELSACPDCGALIRIHLKRTGAMQ